MASAQPVAAAGDTEAAVPSTPPSRTRAGRVTLNFVNADIEAVSRAIGLMLDRQMLVDPRVKGTITVYSDKPLPVAEAYRIYLGALRGLGFTVVEASGLLKVVPEADAKLQTGVVSVGAAGRRGDQVLTQIFHLNHENPNNLIAVLRPLITANNTINASPGNNSLIITDYADNLARLGKIIAALDQPAGTELEIVPLRHALASDIVPLVQKLVDSGAAAPGTNGAGSATSVIAEPRSNSLILRAPSAARLAAAKSVIETLDRPVEGGGPAGSIWVVYLKNADATHLAELLRAALAGGGLGGAAGSSGAPPSSGGAPTGGNPSSASGTTGNNGAGGIGGGNGAGGQSSASTTPVAASPRPSTGGQIQADPSTNALIITAPEALYRQIRAVIDQLDVRRAQIYVESLIVKVDAQKAAEFGFQWQALGSSSGRNTYFGGGTNFGSGGNNIIDLSLGAGAAVAGNAAAGTTTSITVPGNGLNLGLVPKINGIYTLAALAHFLESNVGGNVLSTPNLVALDNEEAKIVVGQNIGIPTGSYTNTGASGGTISPFQTFDRKDVGITLRIRSQIGEGGTVRMTIFQENSSVVAGNTAFGPVTEKSSVETSVLVDDGQLIMLGGLMKDEYADTDDRVPGLASIPVLGNLFKSQTRSRVKSNLMVFLRPIVIRNQGDIDRLAVSRYEMIRSQQVQPAPSAVLSVNEAPALPSISPVPSNDKRPQSSLQNER